MEKETEFSEHIVSAIIAHHHVYFTEETEFWTGEVTCQAAYSK